MIHNLIYGSGGITPSADATKYKRTLRASNWSSNIQEVQIDGVDENSTIFAGPAPNSIEVANECGVLCVRYYEDTVVFECETVPNGNLVMNIFVVNGVEAEEVPPGPTAQVALNDNDWDTISYYAQAGTAANYWAVGDRKAVTLNGKVSDGLTLSNTTLYVYILGINHNGSTGIDFGTFKTALTGGTDVALIDSGYSSSKTSGTWFNMNNSSSNSNGWKKCRMRYYVLGSTDSSSGNDASATTATSPVSNTFMAALPSALRAVMRPMTVYSDNTGGGSDTSSYVTATVDYLPLLAEYEVFGTRSYANSAEKNNQAQYQYYINGNSKVKYKHGATSTSCSWWLRSVCATNSNPFCYVNTNGSAIYNYTYNSYGVAPAFRI